MKRRTVLTGLAALGLVQTPMAQAQVTAEDIPNDRLYSDDHMWVLIAGGVATIGLTAYATVSLGEIVFVGYSSFPNETVDDGDAIADVEALKTTAEINAPISGQIVEVNTKLDADGEDMPHLLNETPYTDSWLVKIRINQQDLSHLMDAAAYRKSLDED
jgi:glycine cleavage system H protein